MMETEIEIDDLLKRIKNFTSERQDWNAKPSLYKIKNIRTLLQLVSGGQTCEMLQFILKKEVRNSKY